LLSSLLALYEVMWVEEVVIQNQGRGAGHVRGVFDCFMSSRSI
jgi:hypothetical protein